MKKPTRLSEGEMKRKQINSSIRVAEMPSFDCRHLPIELIADILSRLTLKDVMRYRCVSKSWFALINDSYFKEKHAARVESCANLILLIIREVPRVEGLYMVDLNDALLEDKEVMLDVCPIGVRGMYFNNVVGNNVIGSCEGLVCSLYPASTYTAIWNPSTTEFNMMPPLRPVAYDDLDWKRYCVISYGFGHDHISGDYKVLAITKKNGEDEFAGVGIEVWVYSLKKKSWAKQSRNFPNLIIRSTEIGTFASTRNALHWIMERNVVDLNNRQKVIVAFDIGVPIKKKDIGVDNGYHEVQQPDYKIKPYCLALGALRGCLCNHSIYHNFSSDLWVMNKESWTRLISFADPLPNWPLPGYVKPIAYSRGGDKVLLYDCAHNKLIWYNLKTKTVTIVKLRRNLPVTGVCLHRNIKYDKRRENIKNDKRREGSRNLFSSVFKIFRCGT